MNTPNRATLKATLFWAGRWLLEGFGEKYRGPVRVIVQTGDGSDSVEYSEESVSSEGIPTSYRHRSEEGLMDFLLRHFASEEECLMLFHLCQKPMKGSSLADKSGLERSRFYTITANMIERGLIRKTDDGYEVCDPMMAKVLDIKRERKEMEAEEMGE
jgi:hypothetical protein